MTVKLEVGKSYRDNEGSVWKCLMVDGNFPPNREKLCLLYNEGGYLVFSDNTGKFSHNNGKFVDYTTANGKFVEYTTVNKLVSEVHPMDDLPVDTLVYVRNNQKIDFVAAHFAGVENGCVMTWIDGMTSKTVRYWTDITDHQKISWVYAITEAEYATIEK